MADRHRHDRGDGLHRGATPANAIVLSAPIGSLPAGTTLQEVLIALDVAIDEIEHPRIFVLQSAIRRTQTGTFLQDATIRRTTSGSFTVDSATVSGGVAGSFTADAVRLAIVAGAFTKDAVVLRTAAGSFVADAVRRSVIAGSFTADAFVPGRITIDAVIVSAMDSFQPDAFQEGVFQ